MIRVAAVSRPWFIVAALLVMVPSRVVAFCLNGNPSVEDEYRDSTFVFIGRGTAAAEVPATMSFYEGIRYMIRVEQVFRGQPWHTLIVFSENSSGRFPMDVGVDYLVFLSPDTGNPPMVDYCDHSGPISERASEIALVRKLGQRQ